MTLLINRILKAIKFKAWQGYLFTIALVALATWLKQLAEPDIIPANVPILYILAVVLTATFYGLGPSILCCILSLFAWDFFFLPPIQTLTFGIEVVPISLVFFFVGVIISYLSSTMRARTNEARKEAAERRQSEAELIAYRGRLEELVKERTATLEKLYIDLTQEVAEHKQDEQALKDSEERLERSQEIAHLGSWELDLTTNVLTWSDEVYRIFGLKPQEFAATYEAFLEAIHPDDRAAVDSAYTGSVKEGRDGYETEHRVVRQTTGEVRYVHEKCQHVRDKNGKIIRSVGMVLDITDRKQSEQALRESEERFRAIAEASPIQIAVSRVADGSILFTNRAYDEAFGVADGELIGRKAPDLYVDPGDRDTLIKILGEQGFLSNYEVRVKRADGKPFWVSTSVRKIQFGGEPAVLGSSLDITERKEIEEALQKSYDRLESRVQERTTELAEANRALEIEIAGHKLAREGVNVERRRFNEVLEMLPVYTILLTPDYHVPFANRFFRERFGESGGKRCYEYLFHRTEPCEICETYTVLKTNAPHHWEWVGPDGHNYDIFDFPFTDADGSPLIMEVGVDVTEQKRAQQALQKAHDELETRVQERTLELQETRDYLDNLFNYANAPIIVWNPEFKITRFNRAFERLTGRKSEEVLGKKLDILIPADKRDDAMAKINRATVEGERWETVEIPIQRVDGSVRTLLWNSATLFAADGKTPTATIAQGQDITERKKAEEAEKQASQVWQTTFDSIADMISIQDVDFKLVRVNKAYASAVGMSGAELYEKYCYSVIHQTQCPHDNCPHLETFQTGKTVSREIFEPRFGTYFEVTTSPIYTGAGEMSGTVHIMRDITERKRVEQMKDEFIGLVSHELRTPMTVINGSLRTAMSEGISPEDKDLLLQNAVEGADSLSAIMENLLELSRYQAGRLQLHTETVDIPVIARNIVERLRSHAESRTFRLDFPDKLPPVQADPVRVERILYNLLENAIKYSPDGSKIKVSARRDKKMVVTSVTDKGIGISTEDQGKVFELFERLGRGARSQGLGLGLVVCKRLVEAQGGRIWVESAPGKGSTFYFTLPAG